MPKILLCVRIDVEEAEADDVAGGVADGVEEEEGVGAGFGGDDEAWSSSLAWRWARALLFSRQTSRTVVRKTAGPDKDSDLARTIESVSLLRAANEEKQGREACATRMMRAR